MGSFGSELLTAVCGPDRPPSLLHVTDIPAREGRTTDWPGWLHPDVVSAVRAHHITAPWSHQIEAADLAHRGVDVVISTGTASGKSLAFQLPIMDTLLRQPRARALYLSPTKALGHDQLRTAHSLTAAVPGLGDVAPTSYVTIEDIGVG
jgi:DEAD/DEAH box helicase domain-containing protein